MRFFRNLHVVWIDLASWSVLSGRLGVTSRSVFKASGPGVLKEKVSWHLANPRERPGR